MALVDITGQRFGKLTVVKYEYSNGVVTYWRCRCDCGTEIVKSKRNIRDNKHGCFRCYIKDKQKNDHCKSKNKRLYGIWVDMRHRCRNPNYKQFKNYGGKGVMVCEEWDSFEVFWNWALKSGYADNLTIDRIDSNGNYCPENCRWLTKSENSKNSTANWSWVRENRHLQVGKNHPNAIAVKCVETGEVFETVKDAGKYINKRHSNIYTVLNNPNRTVGGYHWQTA